MLEKNKLKKISFSILTFCFSLSCFADYKTTIEENNHPFYIGVRGGYASTTWANLVPKDMNEALSTSIPIRVSEGGSAWGFYGGYQVIPTFAVELSYMNYPTANLYFDPDSFFTFQHDGITELRTHTSRIGLLCKFMLAIPHTPLKAFSGFGPAEVHRRDAIVDRWRLSPLFGAGFTLDINPHLTAELGTEYVAGYGLSELDPANHYFPFLYSVFLGVAYRV